MARRRFASSRIPKRSRLRDHIRLSRRRLIHESLERRELLAGPELLAIRPDASALLQEGDTLNAAPREFNLHFTGGANIDESTISNNSIRLIRSGGDGTFDDGNEVSVELGFVGFVDPGDTDAANMQRIVVRPASSAAHNATDPAFSFPDDTYQIQIIGAGGSPLANNDGEAFNDGADFAQTFRLDRGAQVVATVPQPVSRNTQQIEFIGGPSDGTYTLTFKGETTDPLAWDATGADVQAALEALPGPVIRSGDLLVTGDANSGIDVAFQGHFAGEQVPLLTADSSTLNQGEVNVARSDALTQASNQIVLYLDDQRLDVDDATDPQFFRLIDTKATLGVQDDQTLLPELVTYDPEDNSVVLTFADPIPEGNYRLDVGASDGENGTLTTAIKVGTLFEDNDFHYNGFLGDVNGSHNDASDLDLFEVQLAAGSRLDVTLTPHDPAHDLNVRLLDSDGDEVGSTTVTAGGPGDADQLTLNSVPAGGAYFVEVSSADGSTGSYSLDASVTGNAISGDDDNTTVDDATDLGILGAAGVSLTARIQPQNIPLPPYPGGNDEPGHRQIQAARHINSSGTTPTTPNGIAVRAYHFPDTMTNNVGAEYQNLITEEEKQIARSVFEVYASVSGYEFVETSSSGFIVAKGDIRAFRPDLPPTSNLTGIGGAPGALVNGTQFDESDREYGDGFTESLFELLGLSLGLEFSHDLLSVQGTQLPNDVLPGDHDIVHLQRIAPPNSTDIDLHRFEVQERGRLTAETIAERLSDHGRHSSLLDTVLKLYRETASGDVELIASNDNYFGNDSFLDIQLDPGTYFIGVSSTGNTDYDPRVKDSGFGGTTDGFYDLKLSFQAHRDGALVDADGTALDGDADGRPGGVHQFWFQSSDATIFVDKLNDVTANVVDGDGSLADPYDTIDFALRQAGNRIVVPVDAANAIADGDQFTIHDGVNTAIFEFNQSGGLSGAGLREVDISTATSANDVVDAIQTAIEEAKTAGVLSSSVTVAASGRVVQLGNIDNLDVSDTPRLLDVPNLVRIVGNAGADEDLGTLADNNPYLIGTDRSGNPLPDGAEFLVPQGVTAMVAGGSLFKMRKANLDAGTSSANISRSHSAIQLLGTPNDPIFMRSYHNDQVGGNSDGVGPAPRPGDFGGIVFRADSGLESEGVFLNYVNHADINNGGGKVFVGSQELVFAPIHIVESRPTATFNHISNSADAAMSANPDSFNDALGRIGPDIQGNFLSSNTIEGLFIRIETALGSRVEKLTVPGRFDDTDITHVMTENLQIDGQPGGPVVKDSLWTARPAGRLVVDPGVVLKFSDSRIETERGSSSLIAEGTPNRPIIFTSISDDRFGGSGAFDTNGNGFTLGQAGDWSGIVLNHTSSASIDHAVITFGGGDSPTEGGSSNFNAIEVHQAHLRLTNSLLQNNADGNASGTREGRGNNQAATIYVRGSQPVIVNNVFEGNGGPVINLNANALRFENLRDPGRSTGSVDVFSQFANNHGPLVRLNRLDGNGINGMLVRGEVLTTESIWDDTDIVHVLNGEIVVGNHHTYSGLRLQSGKTESLVVKAGSGAGLTATGKPFDIIDRVGGTIQILGTVGHPVVLTHLADDSVGAGLTPDGKIMLDTNGNGSSTGVPGGWRGILFDEFSNDRNVAIVRESERALTNGNDVNRTPTTSQFVGTLAPDQKSGDENRRLGFEIHGFTSPNDATDVDVYSFHGTAGTPVWLDVDRTDPSLDLVIEVINGQGTVLARSVSISSPHNLNADPLQQEPLLGGDYYSQNFRDPGFHYTLPETGTHFVRVRSNPVSAGSINTLAGESRGKYQLQIRQQQVDEFPGSTVQFADIRFAQTGIDVRGLPAHSPLIAEAGELETAAGQNDSPAQAERLVNLLQTDMAAIGIAGRIHSETDVDWYQFNLDHTEIHGSRLNDANQGTVSLVFDIDYADGAVRGDTTIAVYDANQQLIFVGRESDVQDDRSRPGEGADIAELSRGSLGEKDAYIGPVHLPVGANAGAVTYYAAVMSNRRLPLQAAQTLRAYPVTNIDAANSDASDTMAQLTRLEPINSVERVVEDHIGFQGYRSRGTQINPQTSGIFDISDTTALDAHVRPFTLADVVLYTATDPDGAASDNLYTVNPFSGGNYQTRVAQNLVAGNDEIQDIVMRSDGRLFGYQRLGGVDDSVGALVEINPSTGATTTLSNDNIPGRNPTPNVSSLDPDLGSRAARAEQFTTSDVVDALTFGRLRTAGPDSAPVPEYDLYYAVRESDNSSKLYRARQNGDATPAVASGQNGPYGVMGDIQPAGVAHASTTLTVTNDDGDRTRIRFESKVPGLPGNAVRINISRPDNNNANVTSVNLNTNTINLQIGATGGDRDPDDLEPPTNGPSAQAIVDAINNHDDARQLVTAVIVGGSNNGDGNNGTAAAEISSSTGPPMANFDGGSVPLDGGAGTPLDGRVTGLSFGDYFSSGSIGLFGVTSAGELLVIDPNSGLVSKRLDVAAALGSPIRFQGLTLGPQNVEGGDYATTLFAITNNGTLYAIESTAIAGVNENNDPEVASLLRPVFEGDETSTRVTNIGSSVIGLAFSPLDFNLWHPTMKREADAGHGVNPAPDGSRVPGGTFSINGRNTNQQQGGASFHFGFEQYDHLDNANSQSYLTYEAGVRAQFGVLNTAQQIDLSSNPAIRDSYNMPGGALGSLESSSFSLEGYGAAERPTLYFNYFLETEDHGGSSTNTDGTNPFRDSARVFASRDDGATWELLATNNSQLSAGNTNGTRGELPGFLSHLSDAARNSSSPRPHSQQIVQELFDNTGEWRQARIDLSTFAGASDIQLRFDFSTAGVTTYPSLSFIDNNFGELRHNERSIRSLDNQHEGFYIDDIIVGFAERGEMVTGPNNPQISGAADLFDGGERTNRNRDPNAHPENLTGRYQLEVRRAGEYADLSGNGIRLATDYDTNERHIIDSANPAATGLLGDQNRERPQGVLIIDSNFIRDSSVRGINVDTGTDEAGGNVPHQGVTINFPQTDPNRLVPGVVIQNNVIADSSGVRFAGHDSTAPQRAVPFGKIVNNTFVGDGGGTGVDVGANASPTIMNNVFAFYNTAIANGGVNTEIRSNFFQQNGPNGSFGTDAIVVAGSPDLFVDAANGNYYLAPDSLAVDSSLNTLQDRFNFANFKNALGIPPSPLVAPDRDVFGQLRVDSGSSAGGGGSSVFKDRGAVDRADFDAPFAELIVPVDNDAEGNDSDPNSTIVWQKDPFLEGFSILLSDGPGPNSPFEGTGVDDLTVDDPANDAISKQAVTITQNGQPLTEGVDYELGYNSLTGVLSLTPLATLWQPQSVYEITLDNTLITDLAGNALRSNRADGSTQFTILLGEFEFDFGDAPDSFGTLLASNGARHILTDPHQVILGRLIDAEEGLVPESDDATPAMTIAETGDSFTVDINPPATAATVTVEEDDIAAGDTLTLTFGSEITVFELSLDGTVTTSGATAIEYNSGDSAASIASTLAAAISNVLGDAGLAEVSTEQPDEVNIDVNDDDGVPVGAFGSATGLILERGTGPVTNDPGDVVGFLNPRDQDFGTLFSIDVTGSGLLDAWVDFNGNGIFTDPGEQILDDHPVVDGVNEIPVFAPPGTANGLKHARFRVSTAGVLEPTGLAIDGEVEDYQLLVANVNLPVPKDASYSLDEDNEISDALPAPTIPLEPTIEPSSLRYEMIVPPQFDPGFALEEDGTFTYDPEADFYGTDTFTYRVVGEAIVDGDTLPVRSTAIATATITVTPINDPPTAESHALRMIEPIDSAGTTTITMSAADLLDGALVHPDTDARDAPWSEEEQSLKVVQIQVRDIDGNFTPVLTEADGTPLVDPFLPIDDVYTVDTYVNGVVSGSLTITVAGNAVTEVIYQPGDHYNEDNPRTAGGSPSLDGFVYTVADDGATTLPDGTLADPQPDPEYVDASVTIQVFPSNDAPIAGDDAIPGPDWTGAIPTEDTTLTIPRAFLLDNDAVAPVGANDERNGIDDNDGMLSLITDPAILDTLVGGLAFPLTTTAGGTVTIDPDTGDFVYSPADDYYGPDSFTYWVGDEGIDEDITGARTNVPLYTEATVSLIVAPVNDAPSAVDHDVVILEDDSVTMTAAELLAGAAAHFDPQFSPNPWDETNQELRITSLTYDGDVIDDTGTYTTPYGTLDVTFVSTDAGLGLEELTYTPNAHFNVDNPRSDVAGMLIRTLETFTFTVADDGIAVLPQDGSEVQQPQLTTTATLTIEVKPQNDAPVAGDDEISVGLAGSTRWEDYFAGLPTPMPAVAPTEDTTLLIPTDFLLENDAVGPDGADDELNGVNENDGQKFLVTDSAILDTLSSGLAFPLTTAEGGTVTVNADGDLEYTPAEDYYGPDSFTYWVGDEGVDEDVDDVRTDNPLYTEATVSLIVEPVNDAPIAVDHARVILEEESITVTAEELLTGAAEHFDPQILESPWDETNQELRITSLTYDGDVIDASGTYNTPFGTLEVIFASTPAGLGLEELTYTPNAHFNVDNPLTDDAGTLIRTIETFAYTVADDGIAVLPQDGSEVQQTQRTVTATLTIEVKPQNDAPVAGDDEISIGLAGSTRWEDYFANLAEPMPAVAPTEDTTLLIPTEFLLENDAVGPVGADDELDGVNDNDGQKFLVTDAAILDTLDPGLAFPLTTAQGGTVTVNGDGDLEYSPAADYYGPDSFTYWVGDQGVDEDVDGVRTDNPLYTEATVSLIVEPVNDAPIAVDHARVILEDESITVTAAELLTGAAEHFDPQILDSPWDETNQELRVASLEIGGTVIDESGTFDTPHGTVEATFQSTSAGLGLVELTYTPDEHFNVDNPRTDDAGTLIRTIETFAYTVADDGIAVLPQDGSEVQQPQLTVTATLTIEVKPQNDAPVAGDDEISVGLPGSTGWEDYFANLPTPMPAVAPTEDNTLLIPTDFLLENDAVGPTGTDDELDGVNDNDGQKFLVTDSDILDALSPGFAFPLTTAEGGTVVLNGDGDLEYSPAADYYGPDSFTYWVGDQGVDEDVAGVRTDNPLYTEATVSLIVEPVNDPPIAVDHSRVILEDESITVTAAELLAGAAEHFDPQISNAPWDETNQELRLVSLVIGGVVINGSGTFNTPHGTVEATFTSTAAGLGLEELTYTPNPHFNVDNPLTNDPADGLIRTLETFVYTIADDGLAVLPQDGSEVQQPQLTATATLTIEVKPQNDAPIANNDAIPGAGWNGPNPTEDVMLVIPPSFLLSNDTVALAGADDELDGVNDNDGELFLVTDETILNSFSSSFSFPLTTAQGGQVDFNEITGNLEYTPRPDYYGPDSFVYFVGDQGIDEDIDGARTENTLYAQATVSLIVDPVNDAPAASDHEHVILEDGSLTLTADDMLSGELNLLTGAVEHHDPQIGSAPWNETNQNLRVTAVTVGNIIITGANATAGPFSTSHGRLEVTFDDDALESLTYTPNEHFNADNPLTDDPNAGLIRTLESFTYTVSDDGLAVLPQDPSGPPVEQPEEVAIGTVTIEVKPQNDAPIARDNAIPGAAWTSFDAAAPNPTEDTTLVIPPEFLLSNDSVGPQRTNDELGGVNNNDGELFLVTDATILDTLEPGAAFPLTTQRGGQVFVDASSGNLEYEPPADYFGPDSFTYWVGDRGIDEDVDGVRTENTLYAQATVSLVVDPVNDPPAADDHHRVLLEDTAITLRASELLLGAVEHDDPQRPSFPWNESNQSLRIVSVNAGGTEVTAANAGDGPFATEHGSLVVQFNGDALNRVIYTPNQHFNVDNPLQGSTPAIDSFTYTVSDDGIAILPQNLGGPPVQQPQETVTATVTLEVKPQNDPPLAASDTIPGTEWSLFDPANPEPLEDETLVISPAFLLQNDVVAPAGANDELPPASINDGAAFLVTNNAILNTFGSGNAFPMLTAQGGRVTFNADTGNLEYTPAANYHGPDSFTYWMGDVGVNEGVDGTRTVASRYAQATVSLNVQSVNDPPQFDGAPSVTVVEDAGENNSAVPPADIGLSTFPNWATNIQPGPDGATDELESQTVEFIVQPLDSSQQVLARRLFQTDASDNLMVSVDPNGTLQFRTLPDANGEVVFSVIARDSEGAESAPRAVTISVTAVNDPPTFNPGPPVSVDEDAPPYSEIWATNILPGPIDEQNEPQTVVRFDVDTPADKRDLFSVPPAMDTEGVLTFTPAPDAWGTVTVSVRAVDSLGLASDPVDLTIDIESQPDAPIANDDIGTVNEDDPVVLTKNFLLRNDIDADLPFDTLSLILGSATSAQGAAISINADGDVAYDPRGAEVLQALPAGSTLSDSFVYRIEDSFGLRSDLATVSLTVSGLNDAPRVQDDQFDVRFTGSTTIRPLENDVDVDGEIIPTTLVITTQPSFGALSVQDDGSLVYTPSKDFAGSDTIQYTVADDSGQASKQATITITADPTPLASDDAGQGYGAAAVVVDVLDNDEASVGELDPASLTITTPPQNGTVTAQADGTLRYEPNSGFFGTDTFGYTIADTLGNVSSEAFVTVEIEQSPFQNPVVHTDVNGDGETNALDALRVINLLNRFGLSVSVDALPPDLLDLADVNGDGLIQPLDALLVISELNRQSRTGLSGEGERFATEPRLTNSPSVPLGQFGSKSEHHERDLVLFEDFASELAGPAAKSTIDWSAADLGEGDDGDLAITVLSEGEDVDVSEYADAADEAITEWLDDRF